MCGMLVHAPSGRSVAARFGLAAAAAAAAAALLRPRDGLIAPAPVRVEEHFSAAELTRARGFRRPQRAIGLAASGVELALLGALAARPPGLLRRAHPAVAGIGLSLALTAAPLPLRAVARERARRVGLITQSWSGWGADLAKTSGIGGAGAAAGAALAHPLIPRAPPMWWLAAPGGGRRGRRGRRGPRRRAPPPRAADVVAARLGRGRRRGRARRLRGPGRARPAVQPLHAAARRRAAPRRPGARRPRGRAGP